MCEIIENFKEIDLNAEAEQNIIDIFETNEEEKKEEEQKEVAFDRDVWNLMSNTDPETGLDFAWLDIVDRLKEGVKAVDVLPSIFDYYQEKNPTMDSWLNYCLACSHFEKDDLEGPSNRSARRRLEARVKKLMKVRSKQQHKNIHQFMYDNQNVNY